MSETLAARYHLRGRFHRSARLDTDAYDQGALDGYVVNPSAWNVLTRVLAQVASSRQRAFTWTGPYGSGKSSLAVLLSALYSPHTGIRQHATELIGADRADEIRKIAPLGKKGWVVVPVVGQRREPGALISEALNQAISQRWPTKKPSTLKRALKPIEPNDTEAVIARLITVGEEVSKQGSGLLLVFDEMGKVLEHLAHTGGDLYFFQELAEAFSRSKGTCVFIGVLHQAFQEYATQLGQSARDEWAKIQGRFVDIPFSVSLDEVIDLVGGALEGPKPGVRAKRLGKAVAQSIEDGRLSKSPRLAERLARCWPLHPVTTLLLGPLSRTRFGQNERSTFSFLASGESAGFQDFLLSEGINSESTYTPDRMWDYLQLNLEPAILASPDGHRWAEAAEAVERARRKGGAIHANLAKCIGLLDLFARPFGLRANTELLSTCVDAREKKETLKALHELENWSVALYRRHVGAWGLFAGSDVDLDETVALARAQLGEGVAALVSYLPAQPPIVAKRHYHETGTLRWFDARIASSADLTGVIDKAIRGTAQAGSFLLVLPDKGEDPKKVRSTCKTVSVEAFNTPVALALGVPVKPERLRDLALEVAALEHVRTSLPALEGDAVARRELYGRINATRAEMRQAVREAFETAVWHINGDEVQLSEQAGLSRTASHLSDTVFSGAPVLRNELINRDKPSPNAVAARRVLMHRMVSGGDKENLGIDGHPPELGLYLSLLKASGLHRGDAESPIAWCFGKPSGTDLSRSFAALWQDAEKFLRLADSERLSVSQLYERWRKPPFGLRLGVMPILALGLILAKEEQLALYVDDVFTPTIDDLFVDRLLQNSSDISLRRFRVVGVRRKALNELAEFVTGTLAEERPRTALAVAKPLVRFAHRLRPWVKRTNRLTTDTTKIRNVLLQANDPYRLLFIDLPKACGIPKGIREKGSLDAVSGLATKLHHAVSELRAAYEIMLEGLTISLADALELPDISAASAEDVRDRAERVVGVSGDFRLDAFARRLQAPKGGTDWAEGLASLAANKPPRDWTDADLDGARVELADLALRFLRVERLVIAKNREPGAFCLTAAVSDGRHPKEIDFALLLPDDQRKKIINTADGMRRALDKGKLQGNLRLAAIARLLHVEIGEGDAKRTPLDGDPKSDDQLKETA